MPDEFVVTEQHLALLRHAYVRWEDCETGAPAIDCKRPYGNSDVAEDVRRVLADELPELPELEDDAALALHRETQYALEIGLRTGAFRPGLYEQPSYGEWTLVAD